MMDNKKNSPTASHLWQGFLPFAIYIAVNDLVQIILSFLTDKWIEQGFAFSEVLREYAGNVTLITHLIAAFLGYYAVVRLTGPGPKLMVKPKNHEIAGITGAPETTGAAGTTGDKEDRDVYLLQVLFAVLGAVSLALAVNIGFGILGALDTTNASSRMLKRCCSVGLFSGEYGRRWALQRLFCCLRLCLQSCTEA